MASTVNKILVVFAVFMICCVQLDLALQCLSCNSTELNSECRLGQRKFKPKLAICHSSHARCYVLASVGNGGTSLYQRGCSDQASFCEDRKTDYCRVCGSQFCNFGAIVVPGIVDVEPDVTTVPPRPGGRKVIRRLPVPRE